MEYNGGKETIKALVLVGEFPYAQKIEYNGKITYRGFYYDIWTKIKEKLENQYNFQEFYSPDEIDYEEVSKELEMGKYNVCIAPFTPSNYKDTTKFYFSYPILLDTPSILHYRVRNYISTFLELIKEIFLIPLLLIISLGIIIGLILYKYQPGRWINSGIKKSHHIRKSFLTVITTFFGEYSELINVKNLHLFNITFIIVVLILSLFINMYLQATATDKVIALNSEGIYNRHNIVGQSFVTQTGYDDGVQFENWGANVVYLDKSISDIVKIYIDNPGKYKGVILDKKEAMGYLNKYRYYHPNLIISSSEFGYIDETFAVSKKNNNFLYDLNTTIIRIQQDNEIEEICKIYSDKVDFNLCLK